MTKKDFPSLNMYKQYIKKQKTDFEKGKPMIIDNKEEIFYLSHIPRLQSNSLKGHQFCVLIGKYHNKKPYIASYKGENEIEVYGYGTIIID